MTSGHSGEGIVVAQVVTRRPGQEGKHLSNRKCRVGMMMRFSGTSYLLALASMAGLSVLSAGEPDLASSTEAVSGLDVSSKPAPIKERQVDAGHVFVNGEYVEPPYHLVHSSKSLLINSHEIPIESLRRAAHPAERMRKDMHSQADGPRPPRPPERNDNRNRETKEDKRLGPNHPAARKNDAKRPLIPPKGGMRPNRGIIQQIARRFETDDAILVAFDGQPTVILESERAFAFWRVVVDRSFESEEAKKLLEILPTKQDRQEWKRWLSTWDPPESVRSFAEQTIQRAESIEAKNWAEIGAKRRMDAFAYPLTVLGMVFGVFAAGHLLNSLPRSETGADSSEPRPEYVRATIISATLIVALSCLDLVWTLLAYQAGQMRELNPIGSNLINDPEALILFKLFATFLGGGLLVALRHHSRARLAAWWLCLVCTILTFRWVMFNSMFVS